MVLASAWSLIERLSAKIVNENVATDVATLFEDAERLSVHYAKFSDHIAKHKEAVASLSMFAVGSLAPTMEHRKPVLANKETYNGEIKEGLTQLGVDRFGFVHNINNKYVLE